MIWAHSNGGNRYHCFPIERPQPGYWGPHKALCGRTLDVLHSLLRENWGGDSPCCSVCHKRAETEPEGT